MTQHDALVANPERLLEKGLLDLGDVVETPRSRDADQARSGVSHHPIFDPVPAKVPLDQALGRDPDEAGDGGRSDQGASSRHPRAPGKAPYLDLQTDPEV